ncbi:MAG: GDP-fucose synthetase [Zetaproteobacteria bacterium CG_4_9_14_3_um_filter_49_83]|nr:MAG: GDP-fucose synthetase [Zetaproteobacteria bacterium CG1_02_49_23]PIQ32411.1 MAG: GDP-fucose synthetase [Zetaproteobacteria bacterium CG17_big_fil_post_rev_8_21_14_2_50_50_13]PIV30852.1 MAG: GDP-fucose synthetase [Zetaproteobacteria bacterium CG02_land_8_20_14_3_00_50_9]PIY56244.1 MAG: GDP-fucose synthetase [Zetaproteobacteria bacterium CG_4_10_14_0_8_um_filter_49_80]PJA34727.1 MAG: GDP-fucose synthetase [Zetaproteobacteria bacterium CG_4_9_14_3_um_filter_49_83]
MKKDSRIYIAGHRGLVGSALVRKLQAEGYDNLVMRTSAEVDLCNQAAVDAFFAEERPDYVFLAAAKVGGIYANDTYPADFIRENILIQTNVIDAAYRNGVKRFLFLGSSCIYPKYAPQPMSESCLLTGELESTNQWYAIAKIAGIKMCQAYHKQYGFDAISAMPTNLYGPNDNFDLERSHVLPALIRKFHLAKLAQSGRVDAIDADERRYGKIPDDIKANLNLVGGPKVVLWGSGSPFREFLHVDDMADACLFLMRHEGLKEDSHRLFNVGSGIDITIKELAELVREIVGFNGEVVWDASKPDGTPRKLMDVSQMSELGWRASTPLSDGVFSVYHELCDLSNASR